MTLAIPQTRCWHCLKTFAASGVWPGVRLPNGDAAAVHPECVDAALAVVPLLVALERAV